MNPLSLSRGEKEGKDILYLNGMWREWRVKNSFPFIFCAKS
jgi:hypothetical protein